MKEMLQQIWLLPAIPFLGFLVLAMVGKYLSKKNTAIIGVGSIAVSAIYSFILAGYLFTMPIENRILAQTLWSWIFTSSFSVNVSLVIDSLTLIFILVITGVGLLIHIYSVEYMKEQEDYSRFFAYMNLFVGAMLTLVMADNLLLLYLGWEGVGLCSYLLIGFFYQDPANNYAARKAFIVTRIGDTALLIGLLFIIQIFNHLDISNITLQANNLLDDNTIQATIIALLLLSGAVGKSAQLPLQVWLPDAMVGPSPVSALIHAATMVTAGVYLIARMHAIFILSPIAMTIIAIIGAITLLIGALSALYQNDLKRILAYSTISQIGYMFLALGVGAWSAAIFHFMIHAFFKALLFLAAGAVILSLHHEQNIYRMGGLYKKIPVVFWTFLIGSASLAAIPFITGGYFSKEAIIWYTFVSTKSHVLLSISAIIGAFFTILYTSRMIFITFFGEPKTPIYYQPKKFILIPLVVLAILTTLGGFVETPDNIGHIKIFSGALSAVLPAVEYQQPIMPEIFFQVAVSLLTLFALFLGFRLFFHKNEPPTLSHLSLFFIQGMKFDQLYHKIFVQPFLWITQLNKHDAIDQFFESIAKFFNNLSQILSYSINGKITWYMVSIVIGVILLVAGMLWL